MGRWLWVLAGFACAQRIVSRTQIEVQGYSVEKVGLPQSPAPAGKGRFAFIEYWAQGKPKPGYYLECLNLDYYTQWSQPIDLPELGKGKPIRLIGLKDALVVISYDADPLTKGAIQEVARWYDLKGQPLFPKWTPLSVYDRPAPNAFSSTALSPDSSYLLWYAFTLDKKGLLERAWYALYSSSGRKLATQTDWNVSGPILAAQPDNRMNFWSLESPPGSSKRLVYYDTKARTARSWELNRDTVLYAPWLRVTPKAIYVGGLVPDAKNLPHEEGQVGAWLVGRLPLPLSDTSRIYWGRASLPAEWGSFYKEPTGFTCAWTGLHADTTLYTIWEDHRTRSGTYLAYDLWIARWSFTDTTPALLWSYRIEKRQKEPSPEAVSFLRGINETFLVLTFLTERTGKGALRAYLLNHETGEAVTKDLAENTAGDLLILPGRAAYLGPREVVCLAFARPGKNGYQLYHLRF